jgi:hypothetical protein
MSWFLVDDQYPTHPDVLATSLAARGLWVTAGAWSSAHHTDVVPDHVLASLGSTPQLAGELAATRVWKRIRGGYRFVQDGICKIPEKETVDNARKLKTERQRRWREGQRRRPVDASTQASPGPDPSPSPMADVINHRAGGNARASPDVIDMIITEVRTATGRDIDADWALLVAGNILAGRTPASPVAYVRAAIRAEPDPQTRFLPVY